MATKIAAFFDGPNNYAANKLLGFDMDYKRVSEWFQSKGTHVRSNYYTAVIDTEDYSSIRPLLDWLDYNGYNVKSKPTKEFVDPATGRRKVKGNMDIDMVTDMLELAFYGKVDHIYIFSGDGDFKPAVAALQRAGIRVTVVSTLAAGASNSPLIADELRRQADEFLDIADLRPYIGKPDKRSVTDIVTETLRRETRPGGLLSSAG